MCMNKGHETRERIVQRAERIAGHEGLDGLTIGVLATQLGMSKSGLFVHFGNREGLQLAVLQRAVDRFNAEVLYPALRTRSGAPRLRALVDHWLAWERTRHARGGDLLSAAAFEFDDRPGLVRDYLVTSQRQWLTTLSTACTIAIEVRHFRAAVDAGHWVREAHGIILAHRVAQRLLGDALADGRAARAVSELFARARSDAGDAGDGGREGVRGRPRTPRRRRAA